MTTSRQVIGYAVPYLVLKALWLSGSTVGFSDPAVLAEPGMIALNIATAAMDVVAIVVAAPISVLSGQSAQGGGPVQPWVYTVVHSGFAVQGVLLGVAFALYARARWSELSVAPQGFGDAYGLQVGLVALGSVLAAGVAGVHLFRATTGLSDAVNNAIYGASAVAAVVGVFLLLRGRSGWVPLGLAWSGSGAMFAWGTWSMVNILGGAGSRPDVLSAFVEFAKVLGGTLLGVVLLFLMVERLAVARS